LLAAEDRKAVRGNLTYQPEAINTLLQEILAKKEDTELEAVSMPLGVKGVHVKRHDS